MSDGNNNNNETYQEGFNTLVGQLTDIKQIKPGNKLITDYYMKHLFVEEQKKIEDSKSAATNTTNNENLSTENTENDKDKAKDQSSIINPYDRIKQLESIANGKSDKKEKERVIKIIKSLELLVEDPYDNFNIKNFVQEYQKVHDIKDGTGHEKGFINRNERYITDYYAMPYDGFEDGNVQHNKKHQDAYNKRGELIENVNALKTAGKTLKKDVSKSKLKPDHKKEIYKIIDENNKLILEYDSTKTKDELKKLLGNEDKKLKKVGESISDISNENFGTIISKLEKDSTNPFRDNENSLTTYDEKLGTVKGKYTDYAGKEGVAMNPQDESDYMYSVTYKSKDEGQEYADIFGIETIFRILRLTGSKIIPDSANKKKEPYNVFTNYYKTDQKTKKPVYVSEYNKESTWNTNLLDPK